MIEDKDELRFVCFLNIHFRFKKIHYLAKHVKLVTNSNDCITDLMNHMINVKTPHMLMHCYSSDSLLYKKHVLKYFTFIFKNFEARIVNLCFADREYFLDCLFKDFSLLSYEKTLSEEVINFYLNQLCWNIDSDKMIYVFKNETKEAIDALVTGVELQMKMLLGETSYVQDL